MLYCRVTSSSVNPVPAMLKKPVVSTWQVIVSCVSPDEDWDSGLLHDEAGLRASLSHLAHRKWRYQSRKYLPMGDRRLWELVASSEGWEPARVRLRKASFLIEE